ncbi:MAG: 2Fe-2S iron-sulfur cluster-binding protein [Jatrophihabitans sp.]|uniref:2Fe-2S iron-sulfur cluster-binding protein n=1 Tax=Jatrophihabitans sp. TaxID=1932789 RepID=UPI003F81F184
MPDSPARMLRVVDVVRETDDACSVVLAPADADAADFAYSPGQFLTLQLPTPAGTVARCYSLCSSPHVDEPMRVAVKRVRDGVASTWINEALAVGHEVLALPPAGVFTPASLDADLLLFAGGSGITPVLSILKSALATGSGRVVLVYANQHERAVMFAGELQRLAAENPERLHVIHVLESVQGLPTRAQLASFAEPYASYQAFVCGPSPFMETVTHALRDVGVPPARVHIERFQSLTEDPFAEVPVPAVTDDGAAAELEVELDGVTHHLQWPRQTKLLDFLLAQGIKAPYSCRQGLCSACACIVDRGEVKMLHNEILEPEDLAEGYVLGCQSLPISDTVSVRYS